MKKPELLFLARRREGITQAILAGKCGVSRVSINRYERGLSEPRDEIMIKICNALKIPLEDIVEVDNEEMYELEKKMIGDGLGAGCSEKD